MKIINTGTMTPTVSILIVNYNSGARLARALDRLERQTFTDFEVIVFDNASSDQSAKAAAQTALNIRTVANAGNIGFAAANNRAAEMAKGRWLALLNPDAYPEPDWLEQLMMATKRYPDADAFGSTQINALDPSRLDGTGDCYHAFGVPYRSGFGWPADKVSQEGECFAPCAAAALYRRDTFLSLGGFAESFFCYGEDVDLGFRLRLGGGRAIQVSNARVLHEGSGITGRRSGFTVFHGHRNRIWTFVRNMPAPIFWPALPFHLLVNFYLLVRLSLIGGGGAYLRALGAAARGLPRVWRERQAIQQARRASLQSIARSLTWSPVKLARRAPDIRIVAASADHGDTPGIPASPENHMLSRPFANVDGHCWAATVDAAAFPDWDDPSDPSCSSLVISENGVDLGPPHTAHQIIAKEGKGAFSHWGGSLRFSSSDNSDPNANGRQYSARINVEKYFDRRVSYSAGIVRSWARRLPKGLGAFRGRTILEIGPGRDMGTVLIMAALGARRIYAVDRFKGAWQDGWHDKFLRSLKKRLGEFGDASGEIIDQALAAKRLDIGSISFFAEPFEQMGERLREEIDISVSHSVFEHFYSMEEAADALAATTKKGGVGAHNVDFRDHRNFGEPLEFLLAPDDEYAKPEANDLYGRGNRVRPDAMKAMLATAGFSSVSLLPDQLADDAYLADIETRLAAAPSSFRGARADELRVLSGAYVLVK